MPKERGYGERVLHKLHGKNLQAAIVQRRSIFGSDQTVEWLEFTSGHVIATSPGELLGFGGPTTVQDLIAKFHEMDSQ